MVISNSLFFQCLSFCAIQCSFTNKNQDFRKGHRTRNKKKPYRKVTLNHYNHSVLKTSSLDKTCNGLIVWKAKRKDFKLEENFCVIFWNDCYLLVTCAPDTNALFDASHCKKKVTMSICVNDISTPEWTRFQWWVQRFLWNLLYWYTLVNNFWYKLIFVYSRIFKEQHCKTCWEKNRQWNKQKGSI